MTSSVEDNLAHTDTPSLGSMTSGRFSGDLMTILISQTALLSRLSQGYDRILTHLQDQVDRLASLSDQAGVPPPRKRSHDETDSEGEGKDDHDEVKLMGPPVAKRPSD